MPKCGEGYFKNHFELKSMCKFIGWFAFALGLAAVIGFLGLIVLVGKMIVENSPEDIPTSAKYYILVVSSLSAIVIEFFMMLGWYLLIGIFKEDSERLKLWLLSAISLYSCIFAIWVVWVVGLCLYPTATWIMISPLCIYFVAFGFGIFSVIFVKDYYEELNERKNEKVETVADLNDRSISVPTN